MAIPEGESQPGSGQVATSLRLAASSFRISFWSSMFTNTDPCPSACGNSGFPGNGKVATTVLEVVSNTEIFLLRPLKAQTVFVVGSNVMPSGFLPAVTVG